LLGVQFVIDPDHEHHSHATASIAPLLLQLAMLANVAGGTSELAMLASKRPRSQSSDSDSRTASPDPGIRDRRSWVLGSPPQSPG
jgi:hypothetical protein